MAFYAELFDTERTDRVELCAAETILKLSALKPTPCELATVHAINSKLLLDICPSQPFYDLIIKERIRFRWLSEGHSPRQEFCDRLGHERYFHAWPETRTRDGNGGYKNLLDVCEAVRRILLGDRTTTGIESLDARISRAQELFSAIEQSGYRELEQRRSHVFREAMSVVVNDIPKDDEHIDVKNLITELAAKPDLDGRSTAYHAIETKEFGSTIKNEQAERIKAQAQDIVNAVYNRSVAHSLGATNLLSSRSVVKNLGNGFHGTSHALRASIQCIELPDADARLQPLIKRHITWEQVLDALPDQEKPLTKSGSDKARGNLADALAKSSLQVVCIPYISATSGAIILGLTEMLAGWAAIPLTGLLTPAGVALNNYATEAVTKGMKTKIRAELKGFLDTLE